MACLKEDFLIRNSIGLSLFVNYAKNLPIIDFHNHLSAQEIKENILYDDLAGIWLGHDHYKWRIMRACGFSEDYITGNKENKEKYKAFVASLEKSVGNPVLHFSQLELQRFFDIKDFLTESNADMVWDKVNHVLKTLTVKDIISKAGVELLCTTDDPVDSLDFHNEGVRPTFRPDRALQGDMDWIKQLELAIKSRITTYNDLIKALSLRLQFFKDKGCLLSDHSLENFDFIHPQGCDMERIFSSLLAGENQNLEDKNLFTSGLLIDLGKLYSKMDIVMQLHIGAKRNTSKRRWLEHGKDAGFDSMGDHPIADSLCGVLSALDYDNELPRTILYNLNPSDNTLLATLAANFQDQGCRSKIQFGPAWWFNDNKEGIRRQLTDYATHGVLGNFIGMTTDSRSYLSFTRHEYFRRILCDLLGEWAEQGEISENMEYLGSLVQDICYYNVKRYLGLEREERSVTQ